MPKLSDRIRNSIGKGFTLFQAPLPPDPGANVPSVPSTTTNVEKTEDQQSANQGETVIRRNPALPLTTTTMTREELKARRMARVEGAANLVEHFHVKVMLKFLDFLCLVTPFWIILFTTSEVGQLFTNKAFDWTDQTSWNAYAPALLGEAVFAGLTFIWQYAEAYRRTLDSHSQEYVEMGKWVTGLSITWYVFAAISALGQFVYLRHIWHPTDADVFTYALIIGRVTLYIGSDWACAKYLGWRVMTLKKIAQEEKIKGEVYAEMERQEADRKQREAEADRHMRNIEIQIQTEERNAKIAGDVQEIMSKSAVKFLGQFTNTVDAVMNNVLKNVNERLELTQAQDGEVREIDEPGGL